MFKIVNGERVEMTAGEVATREAEASEFAALEEQRKWAELRQERNRRLDATDWTQLNDAPVDGAAWATYRQDLRDLPANTSNPESVVWPVEPA